MKQAHLWIGLIASIFLFIEALTGLLLTEPWLTGQTSHPAKIIRDVEQRDLPEGSDLEQKSPDDLGDFDRERNSSLSGIIRGIHSGRIGDTDISWILDIVAVSIMFLTGSGIYLSIKILRNQRSA